MIVTFISQCEKKAIPRTRRVLDAFADRIGDNTWQTVITEEGLIAVKKLLRKTVTKSTAVSCHWIRGRRRSELLWIVGNRNKFNREGVVPVNTTQKSLNPWKSSHLWQNLELVAIASGIAGLFHDFGKANDLFQAKLNPEIKVENLELAIPAIHLKDIRAYLNDGRVLDASEFEKAPYVLSASDKRVLAGQGDIVYIRGGKDLVLGESLSVYRKGVRYDDPDTKEYLGFEAEDIASGRIIAINGEVATLQLTRGTQEVRIGDRLFVNEARAITPIFYPSNPSDVKTGRILRIMGSLGSGGLNSVIVLNRGERDGVKQGNTFAIYQRGGVITDRLKGDLVRLPSERAGLAMVFRTFDKVSYAIILRASTRIAIGDEVRPPISGD